MAAHRPRRCHEVVSLVQRADLRLVGEQDIDLALDQFAEDGPMPPDTERVGEAQRDTAPGCMCNCRGPAEGGLRLRRVEQIAFEIGDLGRRDQRLLDLVRPELDAGAEIGAHRALPVGGHHDQAARGRRPRGRGRRLELDADRPQVVAKDRAELVVAHLADIGAAAAQ